MALPILDGNQSATTLSSILTSGEHIPAHTVVSLGTQAITDMRGAVSGSVVSISNFPATQPVSIASVTIGNTVTIAGTVTANNSTLTNVLQYDGSHYFLKVGGVATTGGTSFPVYVAGTVTANPTGTQTIAGTVTAMAGTNFSDEIYQGILAYANNEGGDGSVPLQVNIGTLPAISGTVTVGNSVTIGSLPAISGTVTANVFGKESFGNTFVPIQIGASGENFGNGNRIGVALINDAGTEFGTTGDGLTISGTVTANTFALQGTAVTTSNFTSTTASTVLAGYNATREVLTIFNEGAGNLHVCAGATCTTIAYQVRLSAGDYYEVPNHQTTITHSAVFATDGTARVTEVI